MVDKIPPKNSKNEEVTYHKRGRDEGMNENEFIHRYSVFLANNQQYVQLNYACGDADIYNGSSLLDNDVARNALAGAKNAFKCMDSDHDGVISREEFNDSSDYIVKKFIKGAYDINKVPDKPEADIERMREKICGPSLSYEEIMRIKTSKQSPQIEL